MIQMIDVFGVLDELCLWGSFLEGKRALLGS